MNCFPARFTSTLNSYAFQGRNNDIVRRCHEKTAVRMSVLNLLSFETYPLCFKRVLALQPLFTAWSSIRRFDAWLAVRSREAIPSAIRPSVIFRKGPKTLQKFLARGTDPARLRV